MEKEKDIVLQNMKPDDDCRCEVCENAELLLDAAKSHLKKNGKADIAKALLPTPMEILESNVCSVKNQECMNDECINCSRSNAFDDALEALEDLKEVTFYVWRTKDKKIQKVLDSVSGEDFAQMFEESVSGSQMKTHAYNIYRQYSELKHLKKNLGKKDVILSVDFSRNYENKQL